MPLVGQEIGGDFRWVDSIIGRTRVIRVRIPVSITRIRINIVGFRIIRVGIRVMVYEGEGEGAENAGFL